jgi:sigma-B regulation protein RsbU (phosphoserine phosphatase)
VAAEIQLSILPRRLPRRTGYSFGATMVPARMVGGDLYDFIPLSDEALAIVIGDVSDKGVPAAIFMAQTHALIRAEAHHNRSPRETLQRVNQYLMGMNAADLFVTVLYGILNRVTGEFRYARAGHELPLLLRRDGTVEEPPLGQGSPLGIFDDVLLDEAQVRVTSGTTMVLLTDGVTETFNRQNEQFGAERIRQVLASQAEVEAQGVCNALLAAVSRFRGDAPVHDDVTRVAVHAE